MKYSTMSEDVYKLNKTCDIETMSGDVDLNGCTGTVKTMSGDVSVRKHTGNIETMSGDVSIYSSFIDKVNTMSGDVNLYDSSINYVETLSGKICLNNSKIRECYGYNIHGDGNVERLVVPRSEIKKNNKPWFNFFGSTNCVNISYNNVTITNGRISSNIPDKIMIPKDIVINEVNTDKIVVSYYPLKVTGGGTLKIIGENN